MSGTGTVTIANANSYYGGTTLNAGQLNINNASALGSGPLTIDGGTLGNTSGGRWSRWRPTIRRSGTAISPSSAPTT